MEYLEECSDFNMVGMNVVREMVWSREKTVPVSRPGPALGGLNNKLYSTLYWGCSESHNTLLGGSESHSFKKVCDLATFAFWKRSVWLW